MIVVVGELRGGVARYGSRPGGGVGGCKSDGQSERAAMAADGERSPLLPTESGDGGNSGIGGLVGPAGLLTGSASNPPGKPNPPQGEPSHARH